MITKEEIKAALAWARKCQARRYVDFHFGDRGPDGDVKQFETLYTAARWYLDTLESQVSPESGAQNEHG